MLLIDRKMPKSCSDCVCNNDNYWCNMTGDELDYDIAWTGRMPNCPLKEEERKTGKWTTEEVAELLFNLFGEDCACNFSGIDEWLPERCKYVESTCPDPEEKHGCWMQFLLQVGAKMEREQP